MFVLSHEQPRAVAGLRQTRPCSDDLCLEKMRIKVELRRFGAWDESIFIQVSASVSRTL